VLLLMFFLSLIPRPHSSPLFPYTTLFRSALGAYLGALFNLNPLLDRDGYHILVDLLRQPGLRARSRRRLQLRLAGRPVPDDLPSDRKSTRLNSSHRTISYAVFCLKKKT